LENLVFNDERDPGAGSATQPRLFLVHGGSEHRLQECSPQAARVPATPREGPARSHEALPIDRIAQVVPTAERL